MKRSPGIEILRCLLMFLIVFGHCCNYGPYAKTVIARGLVGMTVFSVDTFVLISGWFGISFSWKKVVKLGLLGVFAASALLLFSWIDGDVSFSFSLGWFGNSYLALLFLSPLINAGIDSLRKESLRTLTLAWICYTLIMGIQWLPLSWMNADLSVAGWSGISFNTMCYVYVTGRFLRVLGFHDRISAKWLCVIIAVQILGIQTCRGLSGLSSYDSFSKTVLSGSCDYNSPLVITTAICVFLLFAKMSACRYIGSLCIFMAPSMFTVYLLHEGTNPAVSRHLYTTYCFLFNSDKGVLCAFDLFVAASIVFVGAVCVDLLRRGAINITMNIVRRIENHG